MISNIHVSNIFDLRLKPSYIDEQNFNELRENMILHISRLDGLLSALQKLPSNELSRACSTLAIQRVLEILVNEDMLISIIFFNLIMHILLLVSLHVYTLLSYETDGMDSDATSSFSLIAALTGVIIWICVYFFVVEIILSSCMAASWKQFITQHMDFWKLIEVGSIVSTVTIVIISDLNYQPVWWVIVFIKALVWLKLLAFMRNINMKLATFISAAFEIALSLRWFCTVFIIVCMVFADLMHASFRHNDLCIDVDTTTDYSTLGDYCSTSSFRWFLRIYALILGHVHLDEYRENIGISVLWIVNTYVGVIILLNVLIAIVTGSYEEAFFKRSRLFGKIRVPLLAKYAFVKKKLRLFHHLHLKWQKLSFAVIFLVMVLFEVCLILLIYSILVLMSESSAGQLNVYGYIMLVTIATACGIISNIIIVSGSIDLYHFYSGDTIEIIQKFQNVHHYLRDATRKVVYKILGININTRDRAFSDRGSDDGGLLGYYFYSQTKETVENTEYRILSNLRGVESRLDEIKKN